MCIRDSGKSGLGKTHLLKAIKNRMLEKNPSANVLYTTSENFTNDLIYYLGKKNMGEFHDKYRNVDALLICLLYTSRVTFGKPGFFDCVPHFLGEPQKSQLI